MQCHHVDIVGVKVLTDYILGLQFDDGSYGEVDIAKIVPFKGVFSPLNDRDFFAKVMVNPDIGTICWENGADLSPAYLREKIDQNK